MRMKVNMRDGNQGPFVRCKAVKASPTLCHSKDPPKEIRTFIHRSFFSTNLNSSIFSYTYRWWYVKIKTCMFHILSQADRLHFIFTLVSFFSLEFLAAYGCQKF